MRFFALLALAHAVGARENPIRKVVTLLQGLRAEVEEEGEEAQKLFDKFQCYCKGGKEGLEKSIEQGRADIAEFEATMKELAGSNAQLELEIEQLKKESEEAQSTVDDATGVRTKEHEEYLKESAEITNSISALDKAIPTIQKGLAPAEALAQVNLGASVLLANTRSVEDHLALEALLQSQAGQQAPGTEQILGILEQMRDNFKEDLSSSTKNEQETQATYESLKAAKAKQVAALESELREKTERVAEQAAALASAKENHEDTSRAFEADEEFYADLQENCGTKAAEFDANTRARQEEVQAIGEAIKILNDDSSLDLFKKTLPSPSFVQLSAPTFVQIRAVDSRAERALEAVSAIGYFPGVALLQTKLRSASQEPEKFGPVKKMINDMMANLQKQEQADVEQKDFCNQALPESEHTKEGLEQKLADGSRNMDELKTQVQQLSERIQAADDEISALDASVKDATEQRKNENAVHTKTQAENAMAIQLIQKAKAKLSEIYAPPKEAAPALLAVRDGFLAVRQVETEEPPSADDEMNSMLGLAFTQLSSESMLSSMVSALAKGKADPGAPPPTADYSAKTGQGAGIMALMDTLISDLKLQQQQGSNDEATSQKAYEKDLKASQASREATSREVVAMQEQKANINEEIHEEKKTHGEHSDELSAIKDKIASLHDECDFLLANMDLRVKARAQELDALRQSLSILSGADFGFAQLKR